MCLILGDTLPNFYILIGVNLFFVCPTKHASRCSAYNGKTWRNDPTLEDTHTCPWVELLVPNRQYRTVKSMFTNSYSPSSSVLIRKILCWKIKWTGKFSQNNAKYFIFWLMFIPDLKIHDYIFDDESNFWSSNGNGEKRLANTPSQWWVPGTKGEQNLCENVWHTLFSLKNNCTSF